MNNPERAAFLAYQASAGQELSRFLGEMDYGRYEQAARLIRAAMQSGGRLHVTGIGKPGHVAAYAASLFSSTGTPAYFLHGTEAVHGSCGQLVPGDVVICISNSGETAELLATLAAVRRNGCRIIGVTGGPGSTLERESDLCLIARVEEEGGPLNRAPRNSVAAELLCLAALSAMLQAMAGLTPQQYVLRHPGGALGALRAHERQPGAS
ncbi:carbohydrate isomerase [Oscillospiraceae bacterium]|nr:carbohydrate isomerase [Oscillospiraceae bacterium]BDF76418.1 carbohydrate isomerase [Oscillospiraceae bacterium]